LPVVYSDYPDDRLGLAVPGDQHRPGADAGGIAGLVGFRVWRCPRLGEVCVRGSTESEPGGVRTVVRAACGPAWRSRAPTGPACGRVDGGKSRTGTLAPARKGAKGDRVADRPYCGP
jgi:hypothetical protein